MDCMVVTQFTQMNILSLISYLITICRGSNYQGLIKDIIMWPCICGECSIFVNRAAWYLSFWFTNAMQGILHFTFHVIPLFPKNYNAFIFFPELLGSQVIKITNKFSHRKWGPFTQKIGSWNVCQEKASWCVLRFKTKYSSG